MAFLLSRQPVGRPTDVVSFLYLDLGKQLLAPLSFLKSAWGSNRLFFFFFPPVGEYGVLSLAGGTSLHSVLAAVDTLLLMQNRITTKLNFVPKLSCSRVNVLESKVVRHGKCMEKRIGAYRVLMGKPEEGDHLERAGKYGRII